MTPALILARLSLACFSASLASCVCYRSHVTANFHDHNYTNIGDHREINGWWEEGTKGFNTDINPLLMADGGSTEGGEIRLGFIRPPGKDRALLLDGLTMEDRSGKPVATGISLPQRLAFKPKEFPLCGVKGEDRRMKSYAEIKIRPELSLGAAPYRISLRGSYLGRNGAREPIDARIVMDLERERELTNIADCWP